MTWLPGDAAQCDLWFPPKQIPLEDGSKSLLPVMVITAAHSRFRVGKMIPTRHTEDLLLGMWELLQHAELARVRDQYNAIRLHSSIGYVTPDDEHEGRGDAIRKQRRDGLDQARQERLDHHRASRGQSGAQR